MFKYISEILKSFSRSQRIIALLLLLFSIITISLGPSIINAKTDTCDELKLRIKSQEEQIVELNTRVDELNKELLSGQKECTDNLIAKQREIMDIVNGMIADAERGDRQRIVRNNSEKKMMVRPTDENGNNLEMMPPPPSPEVIVVKDNSDVVNKLKTMKRTLEKSFIKQ